MVENAQRLQAELSVAMGRSRDRAQFWRCSTCGTRNSLSRTSCRKCKATLQSQLIAISKSKTK